MAGVINGSGVITGRDGEVCTGAGGTGASSSGPGSGLGGNLSRLRKTGSTGAGPCDWGGMAGLPDGGLGDPMGKNGNFILLFEGFEAGVPMTGLETGATFPGGFFGGGITLPN